MHKKLPPFLVVVLSFYLSYAQNCMEVGMGLAGVNDWDQENAFLNYMNYARQWFTFTDGVWDSKAANLIQKDAQGYPLQVPLSNGHKVRTMISADGHLRQESYILTYEGSGTLQISGGVTNVDYGDQTVTFDVNSDSSNISLEMLQSERGDHIRNMKLFVASEQALARQQHWNPVFLEKIAPFKVLRFMDWNRTNNHYSGSPWPRPAFDPNNPYYEKLAWEQRRQMDHFSQAVGGLGVAYEYMIDLGNTAGKDIWITVPHNASMAYVRELARLVYRTLDPKLRVYVEYSNELWNFGFWQAHYVDRWDTEPINFPRKCAKISKQIFDIFYEEFGNEKDRVYRVVGGQKANPWIGEQYMDELAGEFDGLAITWYYGIRNRSNGPKYRDQLMAMGANATEEGVMELIQSDFLHGYDNFVKNKEAVDAWGKELITYEGGSHVIHSDDMQSNPELLDFLLKMERGEKVRDMYTQVIDSMRSLDVKLLMPFVLNAGASKWGDWTHLYDIYQKPPYDLKYQVLLDNTPAVYCNDNANEEETEEGQNEEGQIEDGDLLGDGASAPGVLMYPTITDGQITMVTDECPTEVQVVSPNGVSMTLKVSDGCTIDLSRFSTGLYVIYSDLGNFKVIRK